MTALDRLIAERRTRLRALNASRPPSPASDLARALAEDEARLRRRLALENTGWDEDGRKARARAASTQNLLAPRGRSGEWSSAATPTQPGNRHPGGAPFGDAP